MQFIENIKVQFKLIILLLIGFLCMGAVGYTGYYDLRQSDTNMN